MNYFKVKIGQVSFWGAKGILESTALSQHCGIPFVLLLKLKRGMSEHPPSANASCLEKEKSTLLCTFQLFELKNHRQYISRWIWGKRKQPNSKNT